MAIETAAIIPGDSSFNVVERYYNMFPYEMSESKFQSLHIAQIHRVQRITFEKLLDKMIEVCQMKFLRKDTFLVVAHGYHDASDYAYGLTMPLTDNTTTKTIEDVLRSLLGFMNSNASSETMTAYEKNPNLTINNIKVTLPKGCVSRIVEKMKKLRALKVRRVEFRAPPLGTNTGLLDVIGQCFSARFVYAPDVHMFYQGCNPGRPVGDLTLDTHLKRRGDARVFNGGAGRLALQVQGKGASRSSWTETTEKDLGWFVDQFIWDKNSYPRNTSSPSAFIVAGMDVGGTKRYALPLEPEYSKHLIWRGPLAGNQI